MPTGAAGARRGSGSCFRPTARSPSAIAISPSISPAAASVAARASSSPPIPAVPGVRLQPPSFVTRARPVHHTARSEVRRYEVLHHTTYRYQSSVERSSHLLRLFPVHDRLQTVHACRLEVSVPGQQRDFEDVFGNRVRRLLLDTPFTELSIAARSDVEVLDVDPLDFQIGRASC